MPNMHAHLVTRALAAGRRLSLCGGLLGLTLAAGGCLHVENARPPLQPTQVTALAFYIDPEPTVEMVKDRDGLHVFDLFRTELVAQLHNGGFKVAENASDPHDLTIHMSAARVGQDDRPWAESVALDVTGNGKQVTRIVRGTLNWMSKEGDNTQDRVKSAAVRTVNDLSGDPAIEIFAEGLHSSPAPSASPPHAAAAPSPGPGPAPPPAP